MKKIVFIIILSATVSNSQKLVKYIDTMEDKTYWLVSDSPIYSDNDKNGFILNPAFKYPSQEPIFKGLAVEVFGWSCVEEVKLTIQFEDKSKIAIVSWNDFNCKGNAWYKFSKKEMDQLKTKPILRVRLTNGSDVTQSYTFNSTDPDYYINLVEEIKAKRFTVIEEWFLLVQG